ncbi:beta-galactosidase [Salinispirillum sp. LH 10-3-1]|uniref:Beta-galactosidase n=1 Tax=Salinispirillum sp. LH 10-3-1 TaxID=2952525 RepID=A0AB38YFM2_9GAMM
MLLGTCYYPEHWPETQWEDDARRMAELGLTYVRVGEFAWSRIEPEPGVFTWEWLDRALDVLHAQGLRVVMGTPTATPPKWLIDQHPDILAVDENNQPRRFGSRRHYCFSSTTYRAETQRIVTAMLERYGQHPAIAVWQTDNEYGCHNTILSFSACARKRFQSWLEKRYGTVDALNTAWGNVFWSMEYRSFAEIDPPMQAVTETNPSHRLDFRRFSSDMVVEYNRIHVDIIRRYSPGRDIHHNYMGCFTEFDHYPVGSDLDIATWDSYPLGFLDQSRYSLETKAYYLRTGHPDFAGFHHDLYRRVGNGRMWVQEQQPGPVNWAGHNPVPKPGMVRLWTWEGFAHGAEAMNYFRWRQAPFAQEQMHAGLDLPDATPAPVQAEVRQVAEEIARLKAEGLPETTQADVALVFDYHAQWVFEAQPQGRNFSYFDTVLEYYTALRELGVSVDIVAPQDSINGYRAVVMAAQAHVPDTLVAELAQTKTPVFIGPRSGSKTISLCTPAELAPGPLQQLLPLRVIQVESLPDQIREPLLAGDKVSGTVVRWRERVETTLQPLLRFENGDGALFEHGQARYLAACVDTDTLKQQMKGFLTNAGVAVQPLPAGLRVRRLGDWLFAFNYSQDTVRFAPSGQCLLGKEEIPPAELSVWRVPSSV